MRTTTVERSKRITNLLDEDKSKPWNIEGLLGLIIEKFSLAFG